MKRILQIFLLLSGFGGAFGLPSALAGGSVTIGFVPGQGMIREAADARGFGDLLAAQLDMPVKVRQFDTEAELHQWLSRYRVVDCGWLSEAFLARLPAGDVLPLLAGGSGADGRLTGLFVARQGLDATLLQQLIAALRAVDETLQGSPSFARPGSARSTPLADESGPARFSEAAAPSEPATPVAAAGVDTPVTTAPLPVTTGFEPPISLAADQLDYAGESKVFQASGTVILQQGETTLAADELLWQETTRDAAASGHVRLTEPSAELQGSSLHANLTTGLGLARDGRVFIRERNFHLAGEEIERLGEATYRVTDGRFTTCDGEIPDWQFTADHVDVTLGRYAAARNVWFEIRNRPLLYLPYLIFPVKSERESGFLLPMAGYSSRKGALLSLAWYEAIDRHLDATVYLDYLSRIGLGKGLEYRYVAKDDNVGEALYYHVTGLKEHDDTFALKWRHDGNLPGGVRLTADVDYVEDIEYFEDFGDNVEEYARDHTVSTIMLQRNWQDVNLTVLAEYIRDLERDNDATLQRLPEVNLSLPLRRLGNSLLYLRAENLLTNFDRKEGVDGLRLYFNPELSAPFKPGRWLELTPKIALHGRYYRVDSTDDTLDRDDYDDESLIAEYALTASSRFSRVFSFPHGGFDKLKHSIEPQVTYAYIPGGSREKLPSFDAYDRIGATNITPYFDNYDGTRPTNIVGYALVNRLTGRAVDADGNRSYRELLNLRLSQFYDVALERDDSRHDGEEFSDLRVELQANPTAESFLNLDAWTPVYGDQRFSRVTASAGYAGRHGNAASLGYSYVSAEDGEVPSDYLGLNLTTTMLAPVYVNFLERYDFREQQSLESRLDLEYRAQCWSLFLTLRSRPALDDGPDDNEVMVGFALSGIGRVGGFGSRLGSSAK
ncbi:MAG: LPS-assembly protein LptD [Desulfuromonadales bacterium]